MKSARTLILVVLSVCFIKSAHAGQYRYTLEAKDFEFIYNKDGSQEIHMDDFGQLLDPGKPKLPSRIFHIEIPAGMKVNSVNVIKSKPIVMEGTYNITPAPMVLSTSYSQEKIAKIKSEYEKIRKSAFASNSEYPVKAGHFVAQGAYRKHNLCQVRYSPFSYKPKSGKLFFYPSIDVHITYQGSQKLFDEAALMAGDNCASAEVLAREIIVNYDEFKAQQSAGDENIITSDSGSPDANEGFVIITTYALQNSVKLIEQMERAKGREVYTATVEIIDALSYGVDLAEKIRNYLRSRLAIWNISYVMFVGHMDDVPMRYTHPNPYGGWDLEDYVPTDYYYAELTLPDEDSWRKGGDVDPCGVYIYGSGFDSPLFFPAEVSVGRIPISEPNTVEQICSNILQFSMNDDPNYKLNYLMSGAFSDAETDKAVMMEYIINNELDPCNPPTRIYEQDPCCWDSNYYSEYDMSRYITREIWGNDYDDGPFGYVTLAGHGGPSGVYFKAYHPICDSDYFFSALEDWSYLESTYPSIVYSTGCSTASPESIDNMPNTLLEKLKAVAYIGFTRPSCYSWGWSQPSDGLSQTMEYLFSQGSISYQNPRISIGEAHKRTLIEMHDNYDTGLCLLENTFGFTLHGNPDLEILESGIDWQFNLPELTYSTSVNWDYSIVPRSDLTQSSDNCQISSTLPGSSSDTYFNYAWQNCGQTEALSHAVKVFLDDKMLFETSVLTLDSNEYHYVLNAQNPETITGGRHTLWYQIDADHEVFESDENNNTWGAQFVWEPMHLANETVLEYNAPPLASAPSAIDSNESNWDGFSFDLWGQYPSEGKAWSAISVLDVDGASYGLNIWEIGNYTGSEKGFDGLGLLGSQGDRFALLNGHNMPLGQYYTGVNRLSSYDNENYRIEHSESTLLCPCENGPFTMESDDSVDIYEIEITDSGTYQFVLDQLTGTCDLALKLYSPDVNYCLWSDDIAHINNGGDGEDEVLNTSISVTGSYALVVCKDSGTDWDKTCTYSISFYKQINPDVPSNPTPPDDAAGIRPWVNLQWSDCEWACSYDVYLQKNSEPFELLGSTSDASLYATLSHSSNYAWYVVAQNPAGYSSQSPTWTFSTTSAPDITIKRPNGGEVAVIGEPFNNNIAWTSNTGTNVKIDLIRDGVPETIESSTANDGFYEWTVTGPAATNCRITIGVLPLSNPSDTSDADFSIVEQSVQISSPNGGEILAAGVPTEIIWNPVGGASEYVVIKFSDDNGSSWLNIVAMTENDGSFMWTPTIVSDQCLIQVIRRDNASIYDISDAVFYVVQRSILVKIPNGQENWRVGTYEGIEWKTYNLTGNLKIDISSDYGANWTTLASSTTDDGHFDWQVDDTFVSDRQNLIKISSLDFPGLEDTSDQPFTIYSCPLNCDLTDDCCVDINDFSEFVNQWLSYGNPSDCQYSANFTGDDCEVTFEDFAMLASEWLQCE
ncbi:MAG: hypothetical protein JXB29_12375 [Sedimentisphaerales bacterium]|nr:hypothetical protein [Sedimentisphaerales bacterium]